MMRYSASTEALAMKRTPNMTINRSKNAVFRRARETSVIVTNARHAAKTRLYDSENRISGYALTNSAGRGVSVSLAYDGSYVTNIAYALPSGAQFAVALSRDPARKQLVTRRDYAFNGQSAYWYSAEYDILHINSYHSQLKRSMRGFNGVSTKYLNNYLVWNNLVNYAKESDMEKGTSS